MSAEVATRIEPLSDLEHAGALTRNGLKLPNTITYEQYEALGRALGEAIESVQWAVGDWINDGEILFPETHSQAWLALGLSEESCRKYGDVAKRIPREIRREELTWSHYKTVAWMKDERRRDELIELAVANQWTTRDLETAKKDVPIGELPGPSLDWRYTNLKRAAERVVSTRDMLADGKLYAVPVSVLDELAAALDVR